jgi:thioredoxin-related protein
MDTIEFPYYVERVDIDNNRDAVLEYGIRSVPHLILLDDNNNIITRVGGSVSKQKLLEALQLDKRE